MNWKVHDAADHNYAVFGRENAVDFLQRLVRILNMLKRVKAQNAADLFYRKVYPVQVKHPVNARTFAHVSANILAPREKEAQVCKASLARNLKGTELVYRLGECQASGRH